MIQKQKSTEVMIGIQLFFEEKNKTLGLDGYESIISFLKDMKISRNTADYKKKRVCIESDEYEKLENKTKLINAMIDKIIGDQYFTKKEEITWKI